MRWHIVQHGFKSTLSHEFAEATSWRAALAGTDWRGYGHLSLPGDLAQQTGYQSAFAHAAHDLIDPDPVSREVSDYLYLASHFAQGLTGHVTPALTGQDRVVVTYSTHRELWGAARWLGTLPPDLRPSMAFVFHVPDLDWRISPDRTQISGPVAAWRHAIHALQAMLPPARMALLATNPRLAGALQQVLQFPVGESALVLPFLAQLSETDASKEFDLILAGEQRPEKGSELWESILHGVARVHPGVRVALQVADAAVAEQVLTRCRMLGLQVPPSLIHGQVDMHTHVGRLRRAHLVLLPYHPARYALRASGVAVEAFMYGVPVVAPAHTWMGDQILQGLASGELFERWDSGLMVNAVLRAFQQLPQLRERALRQAVAWRERTGAARLVRQIDRVFDSEVSD